MRRFPALAESRGQSCRQFQIAFLQLTSGSTGSVRAVMISHRAAIHNVVSVHDAVGAGPRGDLRHAGLCLRRRGRRRLRVGGGWILRASGNRYQ